MWWMVIVASELRDGGKTDCCFSTVKVSACRKLSEGKHLPEVEKRQWLQIISER